MAAKRSDSAEPAESGVAKPEQTAAKQADAAADRRRPETILDLESRYRDLFESANDVILMADATGNIIDINRQGENLTGYSREELLQCNVLRDLIVPEDRESLTEVLHKLIEGENQVYEVRWRAKDGRVIAFSGSSSPRFSQEGEFLATRCILRDVTARREVEEALRLTQFSVDHAGDAVFWLGPDARFIYVNYAACRVLGYSPEELRGMTVHDIDPDFPPEVWADHWRELSEKGCFTFETQHRTKDGRIFPVELTVNHLEFGGQEYNCAFARDITERKQAEKALRAAYAQLETRVEQRTAELERSNADLQQFAYSASHDLQEPLRMMGAYLQALEQDTRRTLDDQARNFIHLCLGSATRMQQLIDDLLVYARVGAGQGQFEVVDTNAVVAQVIADLGEVIRRDQVEVTTENLPEVWADRTLLGQLFQNLIGNAIKFRDRRPPRVHVSAVELDQQWLFSVRDNGIGIAPEDLSRVFTVFERLHPSEKYPGTGIGLAICKRVVQRHMGKIWCESEPGKGTTFHFSIPKQRRDPP